MAGEEAEVVTAAALGRGAALGLGAVGPLMSARAVVPGAAVAAAVAPLEVAEAPSAAAVAAVAPSAGAESRSAAVEAAGVAAAIVNRALPFLVFSFI